MASAVPFPILCLLSFSLAEWIAIVALLISMRGSCPIQEDRPLGMIFEHLERFRLVMTQILLVM
jgi:hypothetical protein